MRSFSKNGNNLSYDNAYKVLNSLKEISELNDNISSIVDQCKEYYGTYYQGTLTNWEEIKVSISKFEQFYKSIGHIPYKLRSIILDGVIPFDLIKKYKDLIHSSELDEKYIDISNLLNLDSDEDIKVIIRTLQQSINAIDEFLSQYEELKSYSKKDCSFY